MFSVLATSSAMCTGFMAISTTFCLNGFTPFIRELHEDWPEHLIDWIMAIVASTASVVAFMIGKHVRTNLQRFLLLSNTLFQVGWAILALSVHLDQIVLVFSIASPIIGCGLAFGFVTGMVNMVAYLGPGPAASVFGIAVGLGSVCWSLILPCLLQSLPVPAVMCLLGFVCIIPALLSSFAQWPAQGGNAAPPPPTLSRRQTLQTKQFGLIACIILGSQVPGWGLVAEYTVTLMDVGGLKKEDASRLSAVFHGVYTAARFMGGFIVGWAGVKKAFSMTLLVEALALLVLPLLVFQPLPLFLSVTCIIIFCYGLGKAMIPASVAFAFLPRNFQLCYGVCSPLVIGSSCLGPLLISSLTELVEVHLESWSALPSKRNLFFLAAGFCTSIGLIAMHVLKPIQPSDGEERLLPIDAGETPSTLSQQEESAVSIEMSQPKSSFHELSDCRPSSLVIKESADAVEKGAPADPSAAAVIEDPPRKVHSEFGGFFRLCEKGHRQPPWWNQKKIDFSRQNLQLQEEDIVVATFPKCGTTWMQQIVALLLADDPTAGRTTDIFARTPWFERELCRGADVMDYFKTMETFRIRGRLLVKTHCHLEDWPFASGKGPRIIYVARNAKDCVVSYYHMSIESKILGWTGPFEPFCEAFVNEENMNGSMWDHVAEWWKFIKKNPERNFFITFEEMKADPVGSINKVADFIKSGNSAETIKAVAKATDFSAMKKDLEEQPGYQNLQKSGVKNFMRKGEVGDWVNWLNDKQCKAFDGLTQKKLTPLGICLEENARPLPDPEPRIEGNLHPETAADSKMVGQLMSVFLDHLLAVRKLQPSLVLEQTEGYKVLKEYLEFVVQDAKKIRMVLPAFPGKSPNRNKVLGMLPDIGEYQALRTLYENMRRIADIYNPGIDLTVLSDYHTFQEYINIDPSTHYAYRESLEGLIREIGAEGWIKVVSLKDFPEFEGTPEHGYMDKLRELYGDSEFENMIHDGEAFNKKMKEDAKFKQDLIGLRTFLYHDQDQIMRSRGLSDKERNIEALRFAKGMMVQGKALTTFSAKHFPYPEYFRLSIHAHPFEGKKFTVLLLDSIVAARAAMQRDSSGVQRQNTSSLSVCTPWHTTACFDASTGGWTYLHKVDVELSAQASGTILLPVMLDAGEKTDEAAARLWMLLRLTPSVDPSAAQRLRDLKCSLLRPQFGLVLAGGEPTDFNPEDLENLRKIFGLVVLRGGGAYEQKSEFLEWTEQFGLPIPWNFGFVHTVTPAENPPDLVQSMKRLNYHWDLNFPPKYMGINQNEHRYTDFTPNGFYLYCKKSPPPGEGMTTVSDCSVIFNLLPPAVVVQLREVVLKYDIQLMSKAMYFGGNTYVYPLIMTCPESAREILRYMELDRATGKLQEYEQKPDNFTMSVDELHQYLMKVIEDPRALITHKYQDDDILIVNNHTTIHGRTSFSVQGAPRELWRVQQVPSSVEKMPPFWREALDSREIVKLAEEGKIRSAMDLIRGLSDSELKASAVAFESVFRTITQASSEKAAKHETSGRKSCYGKVKSDTPRARSRSRVTSFAKVNPRSVSMDVNDFDAETALGVVDEMLRQKGSYKDTQAAVLLASLQDLLPEEANSEYSTLMLRVLRELDLGDATSVAPLWAAMIHAQAMDTKGLRKSLQDLAPLDGQEVPKTPEVFVALMQAFGASGQMDQCERCYVEGKQPKVGNLEQAYFRAAVQNQKPALAKQLLCQLLHSVPHECVEDVSKFISLMLDLGLMDEMLEVLKLSMLQGVVPECDVLERLIISGRAASNEEVTEIALQGLRSLNNGQVGLRTLEAALGNTSDRIPKTRKTAPSKLRERISTT